MVELFYEMRQNARINSASRTAEGARSSSQSAERKVERLEQQNEKLLMITEALWRIVKKSHKLDDDYLANLVNEIDAEDGRLDGKVAKSAPTLCSACGKSLMRNSNKCIYCGEVTTDDPFKR